MDELQKKIQMFLMKRNQEDGELKFLTARTTIQNIIQIENLCKSISEIILAFGFASESTKLRLNPKCVSTFKYLMLNTNFKAQERLVEDIVNGHLVDVCPPLSPYLFIQIIWKLEYEEILVESILHIPLDLSIEIINIIRSCIEELEFERALNIIFKLIINIYKKLVLISTHGTQSPNNAESIKSLIINFQELLLLLTNEKIIKTKEVLNLKKYQRVGMLLKRIIKVVKSCLECAVNEIKISDDTEKMYKITFGREAFAKCEDSLIIEAVTTMRQDLLDLLLKKIKEIDCNAYMGWAELDDTDNSFISLQKAIGNECYYFVEFLKANKELSQNEHLIECLQHLSSKPVSQEINSILTIEELCHGTRNGNKQCIKELIDRYKEWDETIINFVDENNSLLDKYDCLNLLEYLTFVIRQTDAEDYHRHVYTVVTKILMSQNLPKIYSILVEYITKHDSQNGLECLYVEETFKNFIIRNTNMKSPKILKVILMFILKSPQKVLSILLKMAIGCPEYKNVMIAPQELLLLSPIMSIRENSKETLLSDTLTAICLEGIEWNAKKFKDLLSAMLDSSVLTMNNVINNILVSYLKGNVSSLQNIHCILNCVRKMLSGKFNKSAIKINAPELLLSLAQTMSSTRKRTDVSNYLINDVLLQIIWIVKYVLKRHNLINDEIDRAAKIIIENFEYILEPIDKMHFLPLWLPKQGSIDLHGVIKDYERRCFYILNIVREDQTISNELRTFLGSFYLLREDFLRHVILRSTTEEYETFAITFTVYEWHAFSYSCGIDACDNLLRLTMEACCLCLEYPHILPRNSFTFIMKKCINFFITKLTQLQIAVISGTAYPINTSIYLSLIKNVRSLEESIKHSTYSDLFADLLVHLNNDTHQNIEDYRLNKLLELLERLECFVKQCAILDYCQNEEQLPTLRFQPSPKISRYRVAHEFISACMRVPVSKAYECITRMDHLFLSE